MSTLTILPGDCRQTLATLQNESVQCCVTSPPYYGLRDYGCSGQIGLEQTPEAFVAELVAVFREVRRVLRKDGTCWVNLGDSYCNIGHAKGNRGSGKSSAGHRASEGGYEKGGSFAKHKDLLGIPWMVAFALRAEGWYLRQDIIWSKPNPMPESVTDRCTKAHEYLFLLSKSERYYFDAEAIKEAAVRGDAGSSYTAGKTGEHQLGRSSERPRQHRVPAGWKTGPGSHGSFHDEGRASVVEYAPTRPQLVRAHELAAAAGLTQAHFDAIRACGIGDAGKNAVTQTGTGKNDPAVQALADHAKSVLGGYYREFLLSDRRNKRSVWTVATKPYSEAHFATFPPDLIRPCILAGSRGVDTILDPFGGSGTTGMVAMEEGRHAILCELNPSYCDLARRRCAITPGFNFTGEAAA